MKNKTSRAAFLKRDPYGLLVDLYNISNQNCISEGAKHDIRSTAGMGREVLKENKVLREPLWKKGWVLEMISST